MVQQKLEELNCNKSQRPDEIHPRLLKELSSVIAEPLAKLFQIRWYKVLYQMIGEKLILLHYSRKVVKVQVRIIDQ